MSQIRLPLTTTWKLPITYLSHTRLNHKQYTRITRFTTPYLQNKLRESYCYNDGLLEWWRRVEFRTQYIGIVIHLTIKCSPYLPHPLPSHTHPSYHILTSTYWNPFPACHFMYLFYSIASNHEEEEMYFQISTTSYSQNQKNLRKTQKTLQKTPNP